MRNTFRRWYFWVLLGLMALYVGYDLARPRWADAPMWDTYRRVRLGMHAEDAVAALDGAPPIDGVPYSITEEWRHDGDDVIEVQFDGLHRVSRKWVRIQGHEFSDPPDPTETWWDHFRAWLAGGGCA